MARLLLFLSLLVSTLLAPISGIRAQQASPPVMKQSVISQPNEQNLRILVLLRQSPTHYRGSDGYSAGYADARRKVMRERHGKRLAKAHNIRFVGFWPMPEIGLDCLIMEAKAGQVLSVVIPTIEADANVEWAEPVQIYQSLGAVTYNDPLALASPVMSQWNLAQLHLTATGRGVTIGIIDSGIDAGHPDLLGQVRINRNFIEGRAMNSENHGTGVAGIIGAKSNNALGIVGVAPGARLLGLRACWQLAAGSVCDSLSLAKALHFAIDNEVNVINLSLSGTPSRLLGSLIDRAFSGGAIVVASIDSDAAGGGFPATHRNVIGVSDSLVLATSFGGYRAPGRGVPTSQPGARWDVVNGSSYSAAHISGLFALMIEERGRRSGKPLLVRTRDSRDVDARASLRSARND